MDTWPTDNESLDKAKAAIRRGDFARASEELGRIDAEHRGDPSVLQAEWLIEAAAGHWPRCLEIAQRLIELRPDKSGCWIALGKSLLRLGRCDDAYQALSNVITAFPGNSALRDLLAHVCRELGKSTEAEAWERLAAEFRRARG